MKKSLIFLFIFLLGSLIGCSSLKMNYDLTDLRECISKLQDDDETSECNAEELNEVFLDYQENYKEFFPEDTEFRPWIMSAGSSSDDGWHFTFWFQINEETELDVSLVKTYRDIYKQIIKDFESLLDYSSLRLDFMITGKDLAYDIRVSYIKSDESDTDYLSVLSFSEYYETVTLENIEDSFVKWKYFLELDGFWIKTFFLGKSIDMRKGVGITFYNREDETINNKFEIRSSHEDYMLPESEIEQIVLDNTKGYTLFEREE